MYLGLLPVCFPFIVFSYYSSLSLLFVFMLVHLIGFFVCLRFLLFYGHAFLSVFCIYELTSIRILPFFVFESTFILFCYFLLCNLSFIFVCSSIFLCFINIMLLILFQYFFSSNFTSVFARFIAQFFCCHFIHNLQQPLLFLLFSYTSLSVFFLDVLLHCFFTTRCSYLHLLIIFSVLYIIYESLTLLHI